MGTDHLKYTAVIRTLGTAGEKYQILLDSLCNQTIKPDKILVYIAEGYDIPKETCGKEQYIQTKKGMVYQRSLPFDEVETDWILFCDDDICLEPTSIERLWSGISLYNKSKCISPDVFPNSRASIKKKIRYLENFTFPHYKKNWAFIIRQSAHYSYNNINEKKRAEILPTQSAAGPCCLINKQAYNSIHFEDERFLDDFKYALGEDTLFYYKLYRMGFCPLIHYNAGIIHLDAGTSHIIDHSERLKLSTVSLYTVWHRIRYTTANSYYDKMFCGFCYWGTVFFTICRMFITGLKKCDISESIAYIQGIITGIKYTHSKKYKDLPPFLKYLNNKRA